MKPPPTKKNRRPRGDTQWPGIIRHAQIIGVHRVHLNRVLNGNRKSAKILAAYKQLLKSEGRDIPKSLRGRSA